MKSFHKDYRPPTNSFPAYKKKKFLPSTYWAVVLLLLMALTGFITVQLTNRQAEPETETVLPSTLPDHPGANQIKLRADKQITSRSDVTWSGDSSEYWIKCETPELENCLANLDVIQPAFGRNIFSLLGSWNLNPHGGNLHSIKVNFQKGQRNNIPTLNSIQLNISGSYITYDVSDTLTPHTGNSRRDTLFFLGDFCTQNNQCLRGYRTLFLASVKELISDCKRQDSCRVLYENRGQPVVVLTGYQSPGIQPFAGGRITFMNSPEPGVFNVQMYHGRGIYTWYQNLSDIKQGLMVGDFLEISDRLGSIISNAPAATAFTFKIMIGGKMINPGQPHNLQLPGGDLPA